MALIDTSEYQGDFDAFLAGETIQSPAPEFLGSIGDKLIQALRNLKVAESFGVHTVTLLDADGRSVRVPDTPNEEAKEAQNLFCEITGSCVPEVDFAYGMFGRVHQLRKKSDVVRPHLDSAELDNDIDPVFISLMGVGRTSLFFEGSVVKHDNFGTVVKPVNGEWRAMVEGGIYLLKPTTVHRQPRAPLLPMPRYSWRHFHL